MVKIYVASSWRNVYQQHIVNELRLRTHLVYDFKNPIKGSNGFAWSQLDSKFQTWDTEEFKQALDHPIAKQGFYRDYSAMKWADCCVLVLPCGRPAHLEAGWFVGANKTLIVFIPEKQEPDLMYKMADYIVSTEKELHNCLACLC